MKKRKPRWRLTLQIISILILAVASYQLGVPLQAILGMCAFLAILIILKSKLYNQIEKYLGGKGSVLSKQKPWVKKLIIVIVFILIYMILKQIIYWILAQFGVNLPEILTVNVNQ